MDFELRYIHPVWSNKDQISYIDVSPSQIEINEIAAHSFSANTLAFIRINEDEDAYIGLKIFTENQPTPYVEKIDKTRENLKLIKAPDGSNWWIIANSWSTKDKEYRTQAFNRMGEITVIIGDNTLTLTNETNNFNYEDLQYILNDFKSNLWQIIADRNSITATNVYNSIPIFSTAKSIDNLSKFIIHLEKLLKNPEKKLVETTEIKRRDRSKIIKNSFRDLLKNPSAQYLSSRYFVESFDTPANKYMHFCLNRIIYILNIYKNISFEKQSFIKNILEKQEISKKKYLDTTYETLQREVLKNQLDSFKNQLCKISKKLCDFKIDTPIQDQNQIHFSIKFKEPCKNYDNSYFIEDPKFLLDKKIDYVVLELPENWKEYKHLFQKNYIFEVTAKVFGKYIQSKKDGLLLTLSEIKNVSIHAADITNIKNKLNTEFIDNINVDDIQREKKIVNRNIDNYQNMSKVMKDSDDKIDSLFKKAKKISRQFKKKKIGIQSKYPQSILFVTNKLYSTPYNLYKKLTEEFGINERVITQLEQTEKIGLIKINEIYESWCLISIIKILIERLGFKPDENWADKIIESVFSKGKNSEITFHFTHDGYLEPIHLRLTYQKILPNGKRPDFVLEIENNNDSSNSYTPLILDAKFRGDVTKESIDKDINEMFYGRKYGDYGKVFILHTSCKAMYDKNNNFISLSPLSWGAYSSYGGEEDHIKGHIFFLPSSRYPFSYDNLQRLIGLFLQQNSDLVVRETNNHRYILEKTNNILCIGCGSKDLSISIDLTGKGNKKYYIECNKCGLKTERTLCFCCQRDKLYKNGIHWTYHITKAYQITNVVCPKCNSYL